MILDSASYQSKVHKAIKFIEYEFHILSTFYFLLISKRSTRAPHGR